MWAMNRKRTTLNSNHPLSTGLALAGKCKTQPIGPCCTAWSRSKTRINGKGCGRKGIRHENSAPTPMNMADTDLDPARASLPQRRARTPPWTTAPVSRADMAEEDSSEKKAERT